MKTGHPPQSFLKFFRWFCHPKLRNHIEGDLMELYYEKIEKSGKRKADIKFAADVLLLFRPSIIRPSESHQSSNNFVMLRNYFTIGWRNLIKAKGYSFINIGGLALGMAVAMIIGLWVNDELSFNKYHDNYDRIGQIMKSGTFQGNHFSGQTYLQYPMINELKTTYGANFKHVVPMSGSFEAVLSIDDRKVNKRGMNMGEGAPEVFTWKMIHGQRTGLNDAQSIMISASTAVSLFGDADPVGKMVKFNNEKELTVSGVFEDFPKNSAFHGIQFGRPWTGYEIDNPWLKDQSWQNHFLQIYVEIAPNTTFESVGANIKNLELNIFRDMPSMQEMMKYGFEDLVNPMSRWHLYSDYKQGVLQSGPIQLVWFIGAIGAFVLLLACINFMNLSTARSEKRAKEVGIRKTLGSVRKQLIGQFFAESFLTVIISFAFAIVLVFVSLPWFNTISEKDLSIPWNQLMFWAACAGFLFVTGVLAGSYPAFYLSSFNPLKILKGTFRASRLASIPRKTLVVVQFTVSVMLIACTGAIYHQLMFVKDRPVGYSRDGLLMIQKKGKTFFEKYETLRTELKATGVVTEVADAGGPITTVWSGNGGFSWKGYDPLAEHNFGTLKISTDFGRTVGWKFIDGRDFSENIASDSSGIVLNEAAAKIMHLEKPVGEIVHWKNEPWHMDKDFHILGVIEDMIMNSPFEPVKPVIYFVMGNNNYMYVRINPATPASEAIQKIEVAFNKVIPDVPFDCKFVSQEFATKFSTEDNIGRLAVVFTTLAIIISCLGLFGLASFVAEQRTKEIGIRKVLGASVPNLWQMLSREFIVLILLACTIAVPLSYYLLDNGLKDYEYRTTIAWWIFAAASGGALIITLLTVSFQAIKAAVANPVNSLRTE